MNYKDFASQSNRRPHRYITGIDGIRAIAVMGVIIFHLLPYDIKGGYLGVAIFFVVSGYLITDLLLEEWRVRRSIHLLAFYSRRLKRLYPALVAMLFSTGAYITFFHREMLSHLGSITWTNLLYVYNWWEIGHGQNYFDRFQGESPFTHLWSLSIEGQFYLIWPILMVLMIIILKNYQNIFTILILLSLLSAFWMGYLYHWHLPINRIYYGTDTRLFSILIGCALAFIWPTARLQEHLKPGKRLGLDVLGIFSALGIIWIMFNLSGQDSRTYDGGMLIISILTAFTVASCVHPGADVNRMLTNPIFKWIGTRSYGIYLYQFPVMIFYEASVTSIGSHPLLNALIELILIGVISECSYRWIERPLRRYHYRNLRQDFACFMVKPWQHRYLVTMIIISGMLLTTWSAGVMIAQRPVPNHLKTTIQSNQNHVRQKNHKILKEEHKNYHINDNKVVEHTYLTKHQRHLKKKYELTTKALLVARHIPITAIGDSIMADSSVDLQQVFPKAYVSAAVGRQVWQAGNVIKNLKSRNELAPNVLINLGTNSPMTTQQINAVIKTIGKHRKIYWINCHVPTRYWETSVNQTIATAAKTHTNFHVIDWHGLSENHNEYFWDDHIHPNPVGNVKFVSLIAQTIAQYN